MKLNDLFEKEIVSVFTGERLGDVYDVEIEEKTGFIQNIIIKNKITLFNLFSSRKFKSISWSSVKVIGEEIILVEDDYSNQTSLT